jgi:hypothetical protein
VCGPHRIGSSLALRRQLLSKRLGP